MRKRKAVAVCDEVSARELAAGGAKTKARPAPSMAAAAATKRRRSGGGSNESPRSCVYQLRSCRGGVGVAQESSPSNVCPGRNSRTRSNEAEPEACCSSNGSSEVVMGGERPVDLPEEVARNSIQLFRLSDAGEVGRSKQATNEKMPTEAELEDFFAEAEKERTRRFIEKYNYDIVNDVPLEGRYEWTPIETRSF